MFIAASAIGRAPPPTALSARSFRRSDLMKKMFQSSELSDTQGVYTILHPPPAEKSDNVCFNSCSRNVYKLEINLVHDIHATEFNMNHN